MAARLKRGGNRTSLSFDAEEAEGRYSGEQIEESSPAKAFERQWAVILIEKVLSLLRAEYAAAEKADLFAALRVFIWGETSVASYAEIGQQLNLTEGSIKVAVHRLRQRFREILRAEVAHTVNRPDEIDEELRYLIGVLS